MLLEEAKIAWSCNNSNQVKTNSFIIFESNSNQIFKAIRLAKLVRQSIAKNKTSNSVVTSESMNEHERRKYVKRRLGLQTLEVDCLCLLSQVIDFFSIK